MYLIVRKPGKDPFFNIASEEFLFRKFERPVFSVWQNRESVVVGKHQNAYREVNYPWLRKEGIPVIRRITGGGTVYHGPGNINFSFIFKGDPDNLIDFKAFTRPVIEFLQYMQIGAEFRPKSNIEAGGLKVSGNSAHLYRDKLLYHGTLLFNADMQRLKMALLKKENSYSDKAVDSVPAKVGNISPLLPHGMTIDEFIGSFTEFMVHKYNGGETYEMSEEDINSTNQLVREKYATWQWNFGYSPKYSFSRSIRFRDKLYKIYINVEKGRIARVWFEKKKNEGFCEVMIKALDGSLHEWDEIRTKIAAEENFQVRGAELNQLMAQLF